MFQETSLFYISFADVSQYHYFVLVPLNHLLLLVWMWTLPLSHLPAWPEPPLFHPHSVNRCHPVSLGVTRFWARPSALAAGHDDTSQLQGSCPCHPITHYQLAICPNDSPPLSLPIASVTHTHLLSFLHDYSEVCALVRLAVMASVIHKLFAMPELWHPANRWRTCTEHARLI